MASGGRGVDLRMKFTSVTPSFFKIIQEDTLQDKKFMIPKKFKRNYGDTLSNQVILKLPCGLEWKVELSDDKVCFDKGWAEFAGYYSLEFGHMLVFRYEGNSQFYVSIFDRSTLEIVYPTNLTPFQKPVEEIKDDDSVDIFYLNSSCHKTREKSPLPCLRPQKRMKTNPIDEIQSNLSHRRHKGVRTQLKKEKLENSMNEKDSYRSNSRMRGGGEKSMKRKWRKSEVRKRVRPLTAKEKVIAFQIASDFKSEKPFFMVAVQPSFLKVSHGLYVPLQFAKKYLSNMPDDVILKDLNGRTWPVRSKFEVRDETTNKILKARFTAGWTAFSRHNNLEVGDVCAFVLERGTETLFEVFIFRNNGISNSPTSTGKYIVVHKAATKVRKKAKLSNELKLDNTVTTPRRCLKPKVMRGQQTLANIEKFKALARVSCFKSENPFFVVYMQPSYTTGRNNLRIPYNFANTYINKNEAELVLRVSNGRSWSVRYKTRERYFGSGSTAAELCRGWKKFALDNNLEVGDVCVFELIKGHELSLRVSISRAACDAHKMLSPGGWGATEAVKPQTNVRIKIESGCTSNDEIKMSPMDPISKNEQGQMIIEPTGNFRMLEYKENTLTGGDFRSLYSQAVAEHLKQPANSSQQILISTFPCDQVML